MGNGYWSDGGSDTGASWLYRDNNEGTLWNVVPSGSTWYTASVCSQSFGYQSADIQMDVTPIVMQWISSSIPNNGLVLISSDEFYATGSGFVLKFFSSDTNTIYSPYLDIGWNDAVFITGSLSTSSVQITTNGPWISSSIQSGSSLDGGVSGSFSGSAILNIYNGYITASNYLFPTVVVKEFTGSFSGSLQYTSSVNGVVVATVDADKAFYVDYFSGSLDGISIVETSGSLTGSSINGTVSGTLFTSWQLVSYSGSLTSSVAILAGVGSGYFLDPVLNRFCGFTIGKGLSGNIIGVPVFGNACGTVTISQSLVVGPCGKAFSASLATASFNDGPFSGSTFTAYYIDYQFENAILYGSWTEAALLGVTVNIPIPSGIDPYAYAYVNGTYIHGTAIGIYMISGSISGSIGSNSASFNGQFIDGSTLGAHLRVQLTGSMFTSSYSYTSSVVMTSSFFDNLNIEKPFSLNLQSLQPQYASGDIVKIFVFGRKKFPQKYYGRSTQQEQYLVPEVLPSSSFYALKDNQTNEIVLNFDSYTQISCEYPYGNFFYLDTTGLPQERFYRVIIQVNDSKSSYTIDTGKTFKIVRGSSKTSPSWSP
jgi:hypothetical protein